MPALIRSLLPGRRQASLSFEEWVSWFSPDNMQFLLNTTMTGDREQVQPTFIGYVAGTYMRNSVVFSCLAIRARLFSEARFQFQQLRGGRPGNLFGTQDLSVLEHPENGKVTGDLLTTAIIDADLAGNSFNLGRSTAIRRLRPDWVTIVYGTKGKATELGGWDPDAEVIGYGYHPGGLSSGETVQTFMPNEICHFAPHRDPLARNRGISLITSALRDIMADTAATSHKLSFFENAATPNLALKLPPTLNREKAEEWIELFEQDHRGAMNAYRTIYFGGGAEPITVGNTFQQMTFSELQGKVETRIASLTGMHPVVAALSEGLQGSSLNAGNFQSAARLVGDATLRPLWRNFSGSMETLIPIRPGTRLWYDDRDIAFLRGDAKDRADIRSAEATQIATLVNNGWVKASVVDAVTADGDWGRLVDTGLTSVQLQPSLTAPTGSADLMPTGLGAPRQPAAEIGSLLRSGYTAASAVDAAAIEALIAGDWGRLHSMGISAINLRSPTAAGPYLVSSYRASSVRAVTTFTAGSGPADAKAALLLGGWDGEMVEAGDVFPAAHPVARAFPSLFVPVEAIIVGPSSGPDQIVTRDQVIAARQRLLTAGRDAGYDSLAKELSVSSTTIRRRLGVFSTARETNLPITGTCVYCGAPAETRDHVVPRSRGGSDDPANIVMACRSCNSTKGTRTPQEWADARGVKALTPG